MCASKFSRARGAEAKRCGYNPGMSKTLFSFLLSELQTVRIKCHGTLPQTNAPCGMIYEVSLERLKTAFPKNCCPSCNQSFNSGNAPGNPFAALAAAIGDVKILAREIGLEVEFVLPDDS
jgi:hypothetical protein